MRRMRISIAAMMGLVLACACGIAILRSASPVGAEAFTGVAACVLLTATVVAVQDRSRTGWWGFAIFGWGFAVIAWGFAMHEAVSDEPATGRSMPTMTIPYTPLTDLLDRLYTHLHAAPLEEVTIGASRFLAARGGPIYASFQWIGHELACLLFGGLGAAVALVAKGRET